LYLTLPHLLPAALFDCSVIMGAFFFVRSLLTFVNNQAPFAGNAVGWTLTAMFFFDAWLLGELHMFIMLALV
jgi:hypothetical protein